ncbi:MAG TPA: MFS transporter [Acidiphilium sp.]|nr:MFS transporter [Acidiphilium sp.]
MDDIAATPVLRTRSNWYSALPSGGKRTFWTSCAGYALDSYDVMSFSLAIPAIIATLAISPKEVGLIATVTLLFSAVGGWLGGLIADRFGRVRALQITVGCFALFAGLSGFAQNFDQLFVTRALMGLGFGGEWAVGAALVAEVITPAHRGKAVGFVQSSWAIGWAIAVIVSLVCFSLLPQDIAWRVLFFTGVLPALLALFARRLVAEPALFQASRATHQRPRIGEIFAPAILPRTLLCALLTTGAQGGYYAISIWLPNFLKTERHLTVIGSFAYLAVIILGSFCGYLTASVLADRIGRRRNFILFAIGSIAAVMLYMLLPIGNDAMLFLGFPLGFFASGIFAGMGAFLSEMFPTHIRASSIGFTYNFGRGVAALNPTLIAIAAAYLSLGGAIALMAVVSYALVIIAALILPETRGRVLADD